MRLPRVTLRKTLRTAPNEGQTDISMFACARCPSREKTNDARPLSGVFDFFFLPACFFGKRKKNAGRLVIVRSSTQHIFSSSNTANAHAAASLSEQLNVRRCASVFVRRPASVFTPLVSASTERNRIATLSSPATHTRQQLFSFPRGIRSCGA